MQPAQRLGADTTSGCARRVGDRYAVHDNCRDVLQKCGRNAGVVSKTEEPLVLPGTEERPGDVIYDGIGQGGGDLVVDVTVVDTFAGFDTLSQGEVLKRSLKVGASARMAEKNKSNKKGGPHREEMWVRIQRQGKEFFPVGFETSGASTSQCNKLLQKLAVRLRISGEDTTRRTLSFGGGQRSQ